MENAFYPLIFRQKYIRRWGLMRNITTETLAEHSYEVAVTAHALAVIGNAYFGRSYDCGRVASLALFHDAQEVFTGDLPTPVKYYNSEIRANYAAIEDNASRQLLSKLPPEMKDDYAQLLGSAAAPGDAELAPLVKAADKLCAYIKCVEEEKGGNTEFRHARLTITKSLDAIELPELAWFREHILPAYAADLDQLQSPDGVPPLS